VNKQTMCRFFAVTLCLLLPGMPPAVADEGRQLFQGQQTPPPNDRLHSQSKRDLTVTTAVPSAEETEAIFGADLYRKNIQPVWVQVENLSDNTLFLTPMGLDPAYYSPRESASRIRADTDAQRRAKLERSGIKRLRVAPRSVQSGYIFTRVDEGTKSFNVDVIGGGAPYLMSFFIPVPGLILDHYEVDIEGMYSTQEIIDVDLPQLVAQLERLPCCVRDAAGKDRGDPLNLVFIGETQDIYYAFLRAGWDQTETIYSTSLLKTAASALTGSRYRYSPVSALYVFGRAQDVAFQRARSSIHERNHLRIWLTPLRLEGKPVWIGQISRDIGVHLAWRTITTHKIDPDVDETREFLLEDMAYSQALEKFGYVGGVGPAAYDQPRGNLTGDPYFTDGQRIVMWIADQQRSIGDIQVLDLTPWSTGHISD
jgi:LssY-like putative type I secretion system component LssY